MIRSQRREARAAFMASGESTRRQSGSYPPRRRALTTSLASFSESSMIRTFSRMAIPVRAPGPSPRSRRFVENEPIEAELADRFGELHEIDRLADVAVGPELVALDAVPLLARGRQHDHGEQPGLLVGPDPPQDLEPVHARH